MLLFKSHEDIHQIPVDHPAFPIVEDLVKRLIDDHIAEGYDHDPEADGYIALIEEGDADRVLHEIWPDWTLLDIPWEGITYRDGHFLGVFLANNQVGIVFIIEDADWLDGRLRESIEEHLDPGCRDSSCEQR